jgi:hypothetical protein
MAIAGLIGQHAQEEKEAIYDSVEDIQDRMVGTALHYETFFHKYLILS